MSVHFLLKMKREKLPTAARWSLVEDSKLWLWPSNPHRHVFCCLVKSALLKCSGITHLINGRFPLGTKTLPFSLYVALFLRQSLSLKLLVTCLFKLSRWTHPWGRKLSLHLIKEALRGQKILFTKYGTSAAKHRFWADTGILRMEGKERQLQVKP